MSPDELLQQLQTRGLLNPTVAARLKRDTLVTGKSIEDLIANERVIPDEKIAELKSELLKIPYKKVFC